MSDTPRTDDEEQFRAFNQSTVPADFARELERELAEEKYQHHLTRGVADLAIKHRDEAERENAQLREALKWINATMESPTPSHPDIKAERFLTVDPWGGQPKYTLYLFIEKRWTENGDDTQRVAFYMDIRKLVYPLPNA